ncbi:MAG TPA: molybdate ABC transporter substrate-binding protein [Gaiellaceae bacterium]|nr:molybdate ABC transporter substrate-binding protein [Gaiellaceae bacterium]
MRGRRRILAGLAVLAALVAAGIGVVLAHGSSPRLTVLAAASLTDVLPRIDPHPRYSFAGSNALATQIAQGAPADVFASANTALPRDLYARGLVERPVVFTANALVLVVPKRNPAGIHGVADLRRAGVRLVIAAAGVPVGDYTRTVLGKLGMTNVLGNVVSEETDVRGVLAKVALDQADAGFVYRTDAQTVRGKVTVIPIPSRAQPLVRYAVAVVTSSRHRDAADAYVRSLRRPAAQHDLAAAGFTTVSHG